MFNTLSKISAFGFLNLDQFIFASASDVMSTYAFDVYLPKPPIIPAPVSYLATEAFNTLIEEEIEEPTREVGADQTFPKPLLLCIKSGHQDNFYWALVVVNMTKNAEKHWKLTPDANKDIQRVKGSFALPTALSYALSLGEYALSQGSVIANFAAYYDMEIDGSKGNEEYCNNATAQERMKTTGSEKVELGYKEYGEIDWGVLGGSTGDEVAATGKGSGKFEEFTGMLVWVLVGFLGVSLM